MTALPRPVRYLLAGLVIGGFWYLNRHRPVWEEALRTIAVFAVLLTVLRVRLRARGVDVHLVPLIAGKAVLVVIAAVVEQILRDHAVTQSDVIVAVGLGVAVAVTGLVFDRHLFGVVAGPAPSDVSPRVPPAGRS